MSIIWYKAVLVFFAYVILNTLYSVFTIYIQKQNEWASALIGGMIPIVLAYGTILYTKEPIYIIFVALGSALGPFLTVKYFKQNNNLGNK